MSPRPHWVGENRDANESAIVAALRKVPGLSVERAEFVDLVIGYRGETYLLEVKVPGSHLRPNQAKRAAQWKGRPIQTVTTLAEALDAIGAA